MNLWIHVFDVHSLTLASQGQDVLEGPALSLPVVVIRSGTAGVHCVTRGYECGFRALLLGNVLTQEIDRCCRDNVASRGKAGPKSQLPLQIECQATACPAPFPSSEHQVRTLRSKGNSHPSTHILLQAVLQLAQWQRGHSDLSTLWIPKTWRMWSLGPSEKYRKRVMQRWLHLCWWRHPR